MNHSSALLLNFVNLLLCGGLVWSAVCRLHVMDERVRLRAALAYVLLLVGAAFSGLQYFLFGTFAGWGDVGAAAIGCAVMWLSVPQWRDGPPAHCTRS